MAGPVLEPPSGSEKRTVRTAASLLATLSNDRGGFDLKCDVVVNQSCV